MNWDRYLDWVESIKALLNYTDDMERNQRMEEYLVKYLDDLDEYESVESIASHINEYMEFEEEK